jgi:phosphopantetheinyl transferase
MSNLTQLSPTPNPLPSREGVRKPSPLAGEGRVRGKFEDRICPQVSACPSMQKMTGKMPVPPELLGEAVAYSCSDVANGSKHQSEEAKMRLALLLWEHLFARNLCSGPSSAEARLAKTALGKPVLTNRDLDGPSISFSRSGGVIWAAACCSHAEIGVDAAGADEFTGDYPLHRIGNLDEFAVLRSLTGGDRSEAAALIWSIKESYVKALGCGFHLFDPLQVRIENVSREGQTLSFIVSLSEKGQEKVSAYPSKGSDCVKSESFARLSVGVRLRDRMGIECAGQMAYAESQRVGLTWLSITTVDKAHLLVR